MSKKQNFVSLSTAEAEYIAAGSCWTQLLWMKKLLHNYGIPQDTMCIFCYNTNAINLSKNPVQHSKSKHIEIRYHFIWDLVEERVVRLEFIYTDSQKADIFTKPLDGPRFESLRKTIGVGTIPWISCVMCASLVYIVLFYLWDTHYFVGYLYSMILLIVALSVFVVFLLLLLINIFLIMCQKSKNHIKSRKSKSLIDIVEFCLKTYFALYLCANGFVHLRA